jgi:putative ABC transport system permease protein
MRTAQLIRRNLGHYRRTNAAVVGGVAVAVAVLAGALLVGDSVRGSLRALFLQRLGQTDLLITSTGFFREGLAAELGADGKLAAGGFTAACPVVALSGAVVHDESGRRAGGVAVYGVDARFWEFHGLAARVRTPASSEVLLSPGLARELGAGPGDTVRVRVEKPSAIPVESLHGRKEDVGRTVRLTVRETLAAESLGEFSPRAQQGEVRAVFVSLARLQKEAGREGKANALLLSSAGGRSGEAAGGAAKVARAEQLLRDAFALEDLGLNLRALDEQDALSLESESALLTEEVAGRARAAARDAGLRPVGVFSYLANTIRANGREIPYSLVTALEPEGFAEFTQLSAATNGSTDATTEVASQSQQQSPSPHQSSPMLLNEWAARDLGVKVGDEIEIDYYLWREEGRLVTESARFRLAGVVPIAGLAADRELTPEYPGISDTDSLSDWDPPFPVDLSRVREQDEKYWDTYRTTPKAFIPLRRGQQLWQTRFGNLTSLRLYPTDTGGGAAANVDLEAARAEFSRRLRASIDPLAAGLSVLPVREEGLRASAGATDFGEYFLYFSFFIVVSALLLASLFFKFGVEQRVREIGLLQAVGFPEARIRRLFLAEGFALAAAGSLLGLAGALAYGWLMMWGLRTWWVDAVGTRSLALHVSPLSLAAGAFGGVAAALACVWLSLRALRRVSTRSLLAGVFEREAARGRRGAGRRGRDNERGDAADSKSEISNPQTAIRSPRSEGRRVPASLVLAFVSGALGLSLLALAALKVIGEAAGFFGAGVLLMVALLSAESAWLRRGRPGGRIGAGGAWPVARLGFRNAAHRPGRSILCVALVASAAFIIVSVDAFRQDAHGASADRKGGAGGYALLAEALLPVAHDPNSAGGREALGLDTATGEGELDGVTFARFRLRPGDDASCLNLYRPRDPRVLSAAPGFLRENRFQFQNSLAETDAERENPWLLLERDLADGAIPAVADAKSLAYVLHKKLGDEITVKGASGRDVRLRIVAALADSLFQSELVVAEKNFLRAFPERQGYRYFLIDAPAGRAPAVAGLLEEALSDYGFDAAPTAERLASYHRVENTYLSTFQTLGGLGMLLGTLGLAAVLLRNVFERRRELALLRAVGYGRRQFAVMVFGENALLLVAGLLTGTACALLAIAPAFLARAGSGRGFNLSLAILLAAVLVTGFAASLAATIAALRSPLLPSLRAE